ncbi:hemerythrin domain-containing protein [Sulfurimonas sp. HSL-3221]|uniref:bacteriohemerythrin n=1 Tax=Sulfurimonadaceae TaxID=2771471 RepID=UPI001E37DE43|nr:hemerythrin domain-containing protein [Sulfurimonas sp. HSL-3221]UFS61596.1 hemerythrin domain-containing protein [Sulfurimonas sp. HSL-3221]
MEELTLGVATMDETHADFLRQLDAVKQATGNAFIEGFSALVEHTETHFAMEEEMMRSLAFYGLQEHLDEHETLLSEMRYFLQKARKLPPFGRSYIDDYAYEKFRRHIINIDSQLAMFLKSLETEAAHG